MTDANEIARAEEALAKAAPGGIQRHILLCAEPQKGECCSREAGSAAWNYLKKRCKQLGLAEVGIHRSKADCLKVCFAGPISRSSGPMACGTIPAPNPCWNASFRNILSAVCQSRISASNRAVRAVWYRPRRG